MLKARLDDGELVDVHVAIVLLLPNNIHSDGIGKVKTYQGWKIRHQHSHKIGHSEVPSKVLTVDNRQ